ncbi:MAG: Na/Pi symporter [Candidatus Altiarchaeota archaeon]|nr:Na/Pi symporter [Candidatus Altiarchaeota archaeon]
MTYSLRNSAWYHVLLLVFSIYLFLLSISLMGSSFKSLGRGFAENLISTTNHPLTGFFIGLVVTSVVQSSSCTTSIIVSLVACQSLTIQNAIPLVFGANIGTSVTNVIVSLGHASRRNEFEKAFTGAIVHDIFNLLSVAVLFPVELYTRIIEHIALSLTDTFAGIGGFEYVSPINLVIDPIKHPLSAALNQLPHGVVVSVIVSFALLFYSLKNITSLTRSILSKKMEKIVDKYLFKTPLTSFLSGILLTSIVQSSSITTSIVVPLIAAGILSVEVVFPYVIGANIGTTVTALMASAATVSSSTGTIYFGGVTIAICHLVFNIFGGLIWYPLRIVPISLSKKLSHIVTQKGRYAVAYILCFFYLVPLLIIYLTGGRIW